MEQIVTQPNKPTSSAGRSSARAAYDGIVPPRTSAGGASTGHATAQKPRSLKPLIFIILLSLAPVIAALVVYFNPQLRPEGSVAYGTLVEPQRPMPPASALQLTTLDGQPFDLNTLKGKWVLASADVAECPESCALKLFILRNSHASQGKQVERLTRVWFILDQGEVPEKVLEAYKGTIMVRVSNPEQLGRFAPITPGATPGLGALAQPMWIIDPLGNLILRYDQGADPLKVRDDITKLIKNSRIG